MAVTPTDCQVGGFSISCLLLISLNSKCSALNSPSSVISIITIHTICAYFTVQDTCVHTYIWLCIFIMMLSSCCIYHIPYSGLFYLGGNLPKWWAFSFSRNFPNLEIHDPNNQKLRWETLYTKFMHVHERLDSTRCFVFKLTVFIIPLQYSWA